MMQTSSLSRHYGNRAIVVLQTQSLSQCRYGSDALLIVHEVWGEVT